MSTEKKIVDQQNLQLCKQCLADRILDCPEMQDLG